ncbi:Fur family transcriptional regulator [Pontibacter sp. HSC-36F09]|uniref:Fur family transcriptional regulator n=1 Tax=Pontibacter sp. HSC-36F09 TaxID=2910966 RepID=UPI0020A1FC27|nr:transcriptional repressor [Pontibacter sp. HSC-36F09]MCP2042158.1 Fur family peroxide stress response transcriptional regulator [Pontibacter sp. HSC-36F09]
MQHLTRDEIRQSLTECGLKATQQRIVVLEAVTELHGSHPTAEDVFQRLRPANPTISLGTVYKTLDTFTETGMLRRVVSEGGSKRYDSNTMTHSHIYCSKTKEIVDFEDKELEQLLIRFFSERQVENFEIKGFSIQLTGCKVEPDKKINITKVSK